MPRNGRLGTGEAAANAGDKPKLVKSMQKQNNECTDASAG